MMHLDGFREFKHTLKVFLKASEGCHFKTLLARDEKTVLAVYYFYCLEWKIALLAVSLK